MSHGITKSTRSFDISLEVVSLACEMDKQNIAFNWCLTADIIQITINFKGSS